MVAKRRVICYDEVYMISGVISVANLSYIYPRAKYEATGNKRNFVFDDLHNHYSYSGVMGRWAFGDYMTIPVDAAQNVVNAMRRVVIGDSAIDRAYENLYRDLNIQHTYFQTEVCDYYAVTRREAGRVRGRAASRANQTNARMTDQERFRVLSRNLSNLTGEW